MSAAADVPGEFRAIKRQVPKLVVRSLLFFTTVYGVFITLSVPWSLYTVVFVDAKYSSWGAWDYTWSSTLVLFGTLIMLRWCAVQCLAVREYDRYILKGRDHDYDYTPFVSILVPAYNETDTIASAIGALIGLDYPRYEVIVIDDGSTDDTYAKALPLAGEYEHCTVTVMSKPNGGKWSALNLAYRHSKAEFLLCVDADSRLSSSALRLLVARMSEPGVAAVAGQVTVRNRDRLLTRLQAAEYLLGNGGMRMALSHLGLVTVVPGPIGLYKRSALEEVQALPCNQRKVASHGVDDGKVIGPLSGETFAEDFQLSLSCLALGHRIVYEPRAIAYTKAPHTVEKLINQRYRWMRGTWQVLAIYARDLKSLAQHLPQRPVPTLHHIIIALYTADVYAVPLLNLIFWVALASFAASGRSLVGIAEWLIAVTIMNVLTATIYVLLQDDEPEILAMIPILDIYQALLVNSAWFIAAVDELRGSKMKWH